MFVLSSSNRNVRNLFILNFIVNYKILFIITTAILYKLTLLINFLQYDNHSQSLVNLDSNQIKKNIKLINT